MDPTRIIAIRHGETDWNVETRLQGHLDIPLNATGRQQARAVAAGLASDTLHAIYTSDLSRAADTATAIAQAAGQVLPQAVPALRERAFGVFEGRTFKEIEASLPEQALRWRKRDPVFAPEGGESLLALQERVQTAVHMLAARHVGEQIVLVAHGGVLDMLYRLATGQDIQAPRTWELGNAAINRLLWTPDGLTLVGWADTRHLDEPAALNEPST